MKVNDLVPNKCIVNADVITSPLEMDSTQWHSE